MEELAKLLKAIVSDSHNQDQQLLELSKAIIDRLVELEAVVDVMQQAIKIQHETIKIHTDTLKTVREVMKMITHEGDVH